MPKSSVNASLSSYDDIFSTEESRQEEQREQVQQIPIGELFPFKNHPFKVLDDDSMSDTKPDLHRRSPLWGCTVRIDAGFADCPAGTV